MPASLTSWLLPLSLLFAAAPATAAHLESVATTEHQLTGVAVSPSGRIFVNFPRWSEDAPISVAEVLPNGTMAPYPDAAWNAWSNAKPLNPADHFVCVQSVYADKAGALWVVDPAAPGLARIIPNGPKLVKIDLATNKVVRIYPFPADLTPKGTYLNDVRITPDGRWALFTDSGRGALVTLDLHSGKARRVLDGSKTTASDPSVDLVISGKPLRLAGGSTPNIGADGIAIDPKGEFVYWQALRGKTLYRAPVAAVTDPKLTAPALEARVETVQQTHPADGIWIAADGHFYATDISHDGITVRVTGQEPVVLATDPRLRWPDSLAEGPDGTIYVTASHIQDSSTFNAKGSVRKEPYGVWRVKKGPADK